MKRALIALLFLVLAGTVCAQTAPQKGYGLDLELISVSNDGRDASWEVTWFGPGWYSIYGGCPTGDCDGGAPPYSTSYTFSDTVLPPGGGGFLTHSSFYRPVFVNNTTYSVHSTATSDPNNLHGFVLFKHQRGGQNTSYSSYPVTYRSSYPGTAVAGPGRNYMATINVTGLTPGEYSASAFQRLLHYRTYTTTYIYYTTYGSGIPYTSPCGICVGGTDEFPYLYDYEPLLIAATIPTMDRGGLIALALILAGLGVLVLQRRPALRSRT